MKETLKKSWQLMVVAVVCVLLQTGCMKKADSSVVSSPKVTSADPTPGPGVDTEPPATDPALGSAAIKNFSEYYNALSLACGNPPVKSVTVGTGATAVTSSSTLYLAQAAAVLPSTSAPGNLNDGVVQTALKLAAFRIFDCLGLDATKADAQRLLLKGINLAQPTTIGQAQVDTVATAMFAQFLHRSPTSQDIDDVHTLFQAFGVPTTAADANLLFTALGTGIVASMEFTGKN